MLEYQPNIVLSEKDYDVVGKHPIRPDGIAKVTGRATYGADIRLPGMLYRIFRLEMRQLIDSKRQHRKA